jgi:hypothetical protein
MSISSVSSRDVLASQTVSTYGETRHVIPDLLCVQEHEFTWYHHDCHDRGDRVQIPRGHPTRPAPDVVSSAIEEVATAFIVMYGAITRQHTGVYFPRAIQEFSAAFAVIMLYFLITMKEVIVFFANVLLDGGKTLGVTGVAEIAMYAPHTIDEFIIAFLVAHETRNDISKTLVAIAVQAKQILNILVLIAILMMFQKVLSSPRFLRLAKHVGRFMWDCQKFLWKIRWLDFIKKTLSYLLRFAILLCASPPQYLPLLSSGHCNVAHCGAIAQGEPHVGWVLESRQSIVQVQFEQEKVPSEFFGLPRTTCVFLWKTASRNAPANGSEVYEHPTYIYVYVPDDHTYRGNVDWIPAP